MTMLVSRTALTLVRALQATYAAFVASLVASGGSALVGFLQAGANAVARLLQDKLRETVSVQDFMTPAEIADVRAYTFGVNVSRAIFAAQVHAAARRASLLFPPGGYYGTLGIRYSNAVIEGAGHDVVELRAPAEFVNITTMNRVGNVVTINTDAAHGAWVGKGIRVAACATADFNYGYIVTAIPTATQLVARQLNQAFADAAAGTAKLYEGSVIDAGELCNGNAATAYSGLTITGITINGNRGNRPTPESDLTDWGLALTKFSRFTLDIRAVSCWQGGVGIFINSNFGSAKAYVEDCGYSAQTPAGFDVNSSKYFVFDVISNACKYGARVLDNCFGIIGRATIFNAQVIGFLAYNQAVNESHNCSFVVTVEGGCSSDGVQIGTNFRGSTFVCNVSGVTGAGVREVYLAANRPASNRIFATTRNCGLQGSRPGGEGSTWDCVSYQDGRSGAAGSVYAVEVEGVRNSVRANITDSAVAQVRGVNFTATSQGNRLQEFVRNTLVSDFNDSGTGNVFEPRQLRGSKSYDAPNLAAGAQTSTTITVPGAALNRGDIAHVRYSANPGGVSIYAEVTAADTVTAWITNETAAAIDLGPATIWATVTTGAP